MTAAKLVNALRTVRLRIVAAADDPACFPEVSARVPDSDSDELSFIRLVIWSYATFQEVGRVPLKFLRDLNSATTITALPQLGYLRTWATHNISPGSEHDRTLVTKAMAWFKAACGKGAPSTSVEWKAAFDKLASEVGEALQAAVDVCELLEDEIDGPNLVAQLRLRINRNWDAHRFDRYVESASKRLGFAAFDVVEFRKRHLEAWRKVVSTAEDGAVDRLLVLRVEADILHLLGDALPVSADDVVRRLGARPGAEVGAFLLVLRERRVASLTDADVFMSEVAAAMRPATEQGAGDTGRPQET